MKRSPYRPQVLTPWAKDVLAFAFLVGVICSFFALAVYGVIWQEGFVP